MLKVKEVEPTEKLVTVELPILNILTWLKQERNRGRRVSKLVKGSGQKEHPCRRSWWSRVT